MASHLPQAPPHSRRGRSALLAAWLVLLVGVAASVAGAAGWRSMLRSQAVHAFNATASDLSDVVGTSLRRDGDLTAAVSALMLTYPTMSNRDFRYWSDVVGSSQYPGSPAYGFIRRVPAAGLATFAARVGTDVQTDGRPVDGLTLLPPGARSEYCLVQVGVWLYRLSIPPGLDICALPFLGPMMRRAADTGEPTALSATSLRITPGQAAAFAAMLGVTTPELSGLGKGFTSFTPVYAGGGVPATVAARRAALVGWTDASFGADQLLQAAVGAHAGLSLRLSVRTDAGFAMVAQTSARRDGLVKTAAIDANGRWMIEISAASGTSGPAPNAQAAILGAVGLAVTLLLFTLVRLLATSRRRALTLVEQKTGELRYQALHDSLTRLPNRALIIDRAEQMLARGRRQHEPVATLFIDLDNFKDVNDTFGHGVGDELLKAVAARLAGALRDSDSIGRLGGDEFVVLAEGVSLAAGPELVAERLMDVLHEPFHLGGPNGVAYTVSASIGVAVGYRASAEDLLRDADIALYAAKGSGKDQYVIFQQEMQEAVESRWAMETDLRGALDVGQFFLLYQPTFGIENGGTTGVEALLRWRHPTRGVVGPAEFVPLLEDTGLIVAVGRWVLAEACRQAAAWRRQGHLVGVAVNLSGRQLEAATVVADVADVLVATGLPPDALTLEITESTLMRDTDVAIERLVALKSLGVRLAVDDFGTGYSSLAYLQRFPVDILKIDRSFISGITDSAEAAALIHTLVQLGKNLGLETVAEGIETEDQLDYLKQELCDTGQGFLVSRPLTSEALSEFLAETVRVAATAR